ncbi:MAG: hypothetical protein ACLPID_17090, partial [Beijerinckiaceae bacterium]
PDHKTISPNVLRAFRFCAPGTMTDTPARERHPMVALEAMGHRSTVELLFITVQSVYAAV